MRVALAALALVGAGCGAAGTAPAASETADIDAVALIREHGCTRCHSTTGAEGIGPTWRGLAGSTETLDDGRVVTVDEVYLARSIADPGADIVAGFDLVEMPDVDVTTAEIDAIVAYLVTLG